MRENFALAVGFTLKKEAGYVNDKDDPGGETNFGIAKRYHPDVDIKNLTETAAAMIYKMEYWDEMGCDLLPFPKDVIAFEMAVNPGKGVAKQAVNAETWEGMLFYRLKYYVEKVVENPKKVKYIFGWMDRILELRRLVKDELKRRSK